MSQSPLSPDATILMNAAADGDKAAADMLMTLVYDQLRKAAERSLANERAGNTLSATALVHEAYVKLIEPREIPWAGRGHFYAAATEAMRPILIDHARARGRLKRGGGQRGVPLNIADIAESWNLDEIMILDEALRRLGECDQQIADIVRLRFYAGLTIEQTAAALGISPATVKRRWEYGRTWLFRELRRQQGHDTPADPDTGSSSGDS